ncbi:DUF6655 family protein [Reyranella sp. CPCC 100927]|uniref:DUF6655 family protein n=1 Tax=Reyranella sp. CPCC 100927 TaxID=2599616 RepID=UPI0011B69C1A|nr:DUF6655 family protein [Reyranella sp. CPCC 100927]TWT13864.1 hypothetical protein FQU96_08120 [Reyranella sp. CPCC 100927]
MLLLVIAVAGCSSVKSGTPSKTAMEQMLTSTAADRAAILLAQALQVRGLAFVDTTYVAAEDNKYAISALRYALMRHGARLTNDRGQAASIVEVRVGAMSTNEKDFFVGIPNPRALDSATPATIVLYRANTHEAVAKLAAFVYDARSGELIRGTEPVHGTAKVDRQEVAPGISWESKPADR